MADHGPDRSISTSAEHGIRISVCSIVWTVAEGTAAIAIGALGNSLTLVVFGAIGLLDAVGSGALIAHLRHSIRHDSLSLRNERLTLFVVSGGMAIVGLATTAESIVRLHGHTRSHPLLAGSLLAGVSVALLSALAFGKWRIAGLIPSPALRADGWLSATGALLAIVTLLGTTLDKVLWWSDSAAAMVVGLGAVALGGALVALRPVVE